MLEVVDQGMSALLADLHARGLLDSTLVIWMGEFGRDPRINNGGANAGREHYAQAWTTVLAGGGLRRGPGRWPNQCRRAWRWRSGPSARPTSWPPSARRMGIDYTKENTTPEGRPIRIAATGAQPIRELFA